MIQRSALTLFVCTVFVMLIATSAPVLGFSPPPPPDYDPDQEVDLGDDDPDPTPEEPDPEPP